MMDESTTWFSFEINTLIIPILVFLYDGLIIV